MDEKELIGKIKSKYTILKIFEYIKDDHIMLKLFSKSKFLQKKLNIDLFDYQQIYLNKNKFNINEYLCTSELYYDNPEKYDKNELTNKLKDKLSTLKIDIHTIRKYAVAFYEKYFKNLNKSINYDNKIAIDIFSPFFEELSKNEFFKDIFIIPISIRTIEKYKLENNYIYAFENINKNSSGILLNYKYDYHINYLNLFNINWNNIQTLIINEKIENYKNNNYNYFYTNLFSFKNIGNSLTHLTININLNFQKENIPPIFDNINNLKLLERLELKGIKTSYFCLKLNNLKELYLFRCENFLFEEKVFLNIKKMKLVDCLILQPKSLINAPQLEMLELYNSNPNSNNSINYNLIFNLKGFNNLKHLKIEANNFINVENTLLENIELIYKQKEKIDKNMEKEIIKRLLLIKTLKNINFSMINLNDKEILNIEGCNKSVQKINLSFFCTNEETNFLQNKFPNLTDLSIEFNGNTNENNKIEIIEDINSKANKLSIINCHGNMNIFCQSFENLIELNVRAKYNINNISNFFPIFNKNCKVIFHSLIKFKFNNYFNTIDNNDLFNVYNNLDYLPKLELFEFISLIGPDINNYFQDFIRKLLQKKIKSIVLKIQLYRFESNYIYSNKDLRKIYPEIDFHNYNYLKIYDYSSDNDLNINIK